AVQARIRLRGVDAALAVDFVAHVGCSACCAGAAALILRSDAPALILRSERSERLEGWRRQPHASRRRLRRLLSMRAAGPELENATTSARLPAICASQCDLARA